MPTVPVYVKNWTYKLLLKDAQHKNARPAAVIQKIVETHYAEKRVQTA